MTFSTNWAASSCLVSAGGLVGNLTVLPQRLVFLIKPGLRQIETPVK
jgi:hypothetical protein